MYFSLRSLLTVCLISQSVVVFRLSEASKDVGFKRQVFENVVAEVECCKCKEKIQVNPFDMLNYVHGAKTMKEPDEKPSYLKGESCPQTDSINIQTKLYLQRFVNLLLIASGLKDFQLDSGHKIVNMEFNITYQELKLMQDYANSGNGKLERIDGALSRILRQKNVKTVHKGNGFFADFDSVYYSKVVLTTLATLPVNYPMICIAVFVSLVFIVTVRHMRRYTLFYSMVLMLFIIFCAGFGWNWLRMIKEEEAKIASTYALHLSQLPIHCRPHDMTWYQRVWYHSYEKDCEKYFKEISIDPVVRISPTLVLSETVTMMLLHPAGKIGSAFGEFLAAFIEPIPWAHKWYLVPIVLVLMFFTFFFTYVVLIGGVISFKTILGSFEIGYRERGYPRIEDLRPAPARQMIENVPREEEEEEERGGRLRRIEGERDEGRRRGENEREGERIRGNEREERRRTPENRREEGGGGEGSGRRRRRIMEGGGDDEGRRIDGERGEGRWVERVGEGGGRGEIDEGRGGDSPKRKGRIEVWDKRREGGGREGGGREGGGREGGGGGEGKEGGEEGRWVDRVGREGGGGGGRVRLELRAGGDPGDEKEEEERWVKEESRQGDMRRGYGGICDKCKGDGRMKKERGGDGRDSGGIDKEEEEEGKKNCAVGGRLEGKEEDLKRSEQNEIKNVENRRDKVGGYVRRLNKEEEEEEEEGECSGKDKIREEGEGEEEEDDDNVHSNFSPRAFKELKSIYKRFRNIVANKENDVDDDDDDDESQSDTPNISGVDKIGKGTKS